MSPPSTHSTPRLFKTVPRTNGSRACSATDRASSRTAILSPLSSSTIGRWQSANASAAASSASRAHVRACCQSPLVSSPSSLPRYAVQGRSRISARWMPNGMCGRSRSSRIASAAAGHGTIRLHELAMPFSIDSTTAALTASCMPKSSQFTISTRASAAKPSSSLDNRSTTSVCPTARQPPIRRILADAARDPLSSPVCESG